MVKENIINPDLDFIREIVKAGGDTGAMGYEGQTAE